jgi:hypothetical protein
MQTRRTLLVIAAALAFPVALAGAGGLDEQDREKDNAPENVLVEFGSPHPQPVPAQLSHVLVPDEATIRERGTVTFRVNGGGHGIAIYPVSKRTTREDITEDLCVHDPATNLCVDPAFANEDHTITDGKHRRVIESGTNPPVVRLDDPTDRLLGTTTQIDDVGGTFHPGTAAAGGPGTFIRFQFLKTGRYLVICMNRAHSLNDWMFGFVNVVGHHGHLDADGDGGDQE